MSGSPSILAPSLLAELARRYDIRRLLGQGGMGAVWLCYERTLDRSVAIKVMQADLAGDPEASGRFLSEARIAAKLHHNGIVGLLSFDEVEGTRYFVMPYIEGETLQARLKAGPLSEDEASKIIGEVADALAYAHAHDVVHRDIKPANILLTGTPEHAVIADFGIARLANASRLTATGGVVGTPAYMSPEQCAGDRNIDYRSDIYSLGVVAYELVVGTPPFSGSVYELLHRHQHEIPAPVTVKAPNTSPVYSAVVAKCLAKKKNERWQSAADVAHALHSTYDDLDPSDLRPTRHVLAYGLLGAVAMATWGAVPLSAIAPDEMPLPLLASIWVVASAVPAIWAVTVFLQRRPKSRRTFAEAMNVAMRVPSWWTAWWPRRWLPIADRSRELPRRPRAASRWYVAFSTAVVAAVALPGIAINALMAFPATEAAQVQATTWWQTLAALAFVVAPSAIALTLIGFAWSWWRAREEIGWIESAHARRLFARLRSPEMWRSSWTRLLIDRAAANRTEAPETFVALVQSAMGIARQLSAAGRTVDSSVIGTLEESQLADAAWNQEAQQLEADATSSDYDRIRARLRAIDEMTSPRADQVAERDLLERQLGLHEKRASRIREIGLQRQALYAAVVPLWRRLHGYRQSGSQAEPDSAEFLRLVNEVRAVLGLSSRETLTQAATTKAVAPPVA